MEVTDEVQTPLFSTSSDDEQHAAPRAALPPAAAKKLNRANDASLQSLGEPSFTRLPKHEVQYWIKEAIRRFNRSIELRQRHMKSMVENGEEKQAEVLQYYVVSWCDAPLMWRLYTHWSGRDAFYGEALPISKLHLLMLNPRAACTPQNVVYVNSDNSQYRVSRSTHSNREHMIFDEAAYELMRAHAERFSVFGPSPERAPPFRSLVEASLSLDFLQKSTPVNRPPKPTKDGGVRARKGTRWWP